MKKLRLIMRIVTIGLFVLTIVGIIMLIFNERLNWLDTSYEIIAFSLGTSGMILAVVAQIDQYQDEKRFKQMLAEIRNLNREHDDDEKVDAKFQKKLDALMQFDQKIYRKLSRKK
ncbi:hypothetical protein FWG95_04470 [Candidatus Saccharibacteria bacterium]|nr:hypothetical protein [Candidatus Saccharibacteria bacterium]